MENLLQLSRRVVQICGRRQVVVGVSRAYESASFRTFLSSYRRNFQQTQISSRCCYCSEAKKKVVAAEEEERSAAQEQDVPEENKLVEIENQRHRKEKKRLNDLILKPSLEEEAKETRRYELDLPPVEEERHVYWKSRPDRSVNKNLIRVELFEELKTKNKETFEMSLEMFAERDIHLRGHVEFIYAALSQMKKFGVHRDLGAYKKIMDVFPKGQMIASNMFQVEFMHYPKQQQCAIDILEQMEDLGVIPDIEVQQMLTNIFGSQSFPMRKAGRMLYWMPKFKNLSPWKLPDPLPDDCLELAKIAVKRMTSVDLSTKVEVYHAEELQDAYDLTWIVSGQSVEQQNLIEAHPKNQPIYVEGAFRVWLNRVCLNYFILRAEPRAKPKLNRDPDDVSKLDVIFEEEYQTALESLSSVHEQDDGVILSVCCTGTSSRDSLVSWIQFLVKNNPRLGTDIPILFTLKSPIGPTDDLEIPSFEEAEKLKMISGSKEEGFSVGSGGKLGVDPRLPNVKQMGVWSESESVFPNWPHNHHSEDSPSFKNYEENKKLVEELETNIQMKKKRAVLRTTDAEDKKHIKS